MISEHLNGAATATAVMSAAAIDFGWLNELPKGVLVGLLLTSLGIVGMLFKRELKRRDDKDNEQELKIQAQHDRIVVLETMQGLRGRRKDDPPLPSEERKT